MKTFSEMGINANPLTWPEGWKRTPVKKKSAFKTAFARARNQLFHELKLLGVGDWNVILSTNIPLRKDGLPYAGMAQPNDTGVAVYFRYNEKRMVFACDTYHKVEDNLYAITKTIEAMRGIQRWGASDMMERSFTGFQALPPPKQEPKTWWEILNLNSSSVSKEQLKEAYRKLAFENHPDRGGSESRMAEINKAYEQGLKN